MNLFTVLFAVINTLIVLAYAKKAFRSDRWRCLTPLLASAITGFVIAFLLQEVFSETALFFILSFAVLFSLLPFYYAKKTRLLLLFLAVTLVEFFYATYTYGALLYPFIQMFAIGTAYGVIHLEGLGAFHQKLKKRSNKSIEVKRDLIHILLGVVILAVFLLVPFYYAIYITTTLVLIGYIYNSALGSRGGRFYTLLNALERPEALYGSGALYLGIGTMLLLGFIHNLHFAIIGISALFFADPIATIVGINFNSIKLFYNKRKSLFGTIAFFLVVSAVGYPFIGYYALLFGVALAIVESLEIPIDDNISIAVVMIILYVIFLASVSQLPF